MLKKLCSSFFSAHYYAVIVLYNEVQSADAGMEYSNLRLPTICLNEQQGRRLIVDNSSTYDILTYWPNLKCIFNAEILTSVSIQLLTDRHTFDSYLILKINSRYIFIYFYFWVSHAALRWSYSGSLLQLIQLDFPIKSVRIIVICVTCDADPALGWYWEANFPSCLLTGW